MSDTEVKAYLEQMQAVQQEILDQLADLDRPELKYATGNERWNTVRRVMLRFGDHVREHTTQLVAARDDIGAQQTMPQRMLARAQEAYGVWLGAMLGLQDEQLDQVPEPGEWTPRQILEHLVATQKLYLEMIRRARETASPVEKD
ncbi:MAG: DinB family protein [Chloroflexi bacterium]|jgi:uncharacterized damage-inducible protein DinB|nr:DinB family protein [Chloroflexota bacterium]